MLEEGRADVLAPTVKAMEDLENMPGIKAGRGSSPSSQTKQAMERREDASLFRGWDHKGSPLPCPRQACTVWLRRDDLTALARWKTSSRRWTALSSLMAMESLQLGAKERGRLVFYCQPLASWPLKVRELRSAGMSRVDSEELIQDGN